jgi:translation initiation factor IF-2
MAEKQIIEIPNFLTVRELAELINVSPIDVIKELMSNGVMASINQQIDYDTAAIVIEEMGFEARMLKIEDVEAEAEDTTPEWRSFYEDEDVEDLQRRPPIVAVLGHVDHGKTTLLDTIRKTRVQAGEYGGITQKIGAYQVEHAGSKITFIDTPGHEAFTEMRARGARGADIAVLVVAADDGVMPQTREALNHARAANVPIVVALNKIDRDNARPEFVKQQLAELGLIPDEWDGDTLVIPVSATEGIGIEDLLEAITLVAEDTEVLANPEVSAAGTVLEAEIEQGRGILATLLVQNGTLYTGDAVVAGLTSGRVRAMFDETGSRVKAVGPSEPALVMGLSEMPLAGDLFEVVENEKVARAIAEERRLESEAPTVSPTQPTLDDIFAQFKAGDVKELNLIVKADVQGMLNPIVSHLNALETDELGIKILAAETGDIKESDVQLADVSDAIVIGFQVGVENSARRVADSLGVDVRLYNIIYNIFDDVEKALHGLLEPEYTEQTIGTAIVRQVFSISRVGKIAGCYVRDGQIRRNAKARVHRNGKVIVDQADITSLKRFEEDVREVNAGYECGLNVSGFDGFREGDVIECFTVERVRR